MDSQATQPSFILTERLADGSVEWVPLEVPQRVPAAPEASYTLIDRARYEAPEDLQAARRGDDLVVEVNDTEVLVLEDFFTAEGVAFYPTTDIASGAGPFAGTPLTPEAAVLAGSPEGEQVVWSAEPLEAPADPDEPQVAAGQSSGGGSNALLYGGLAVGGLGLLAAAGGGGGGGGGGDGGGGGGGGGDTTPPNITSGTTAAAIAENSGAGQVVYDAEATDAGTITWSLAASDDADAFTINAGTGAVTLTANPDFEAQSSYTFTVVATDAANNSAQQTVSLSITDQDESAPSITSGDTATAILENSGAAQVVYTATATDDGTFTWTLTGPDADSFSIDANSGAVTLLDQPDFETKPSYSFTVVATDGGGNSAEQAVSLEITDQDDSAPRIDSGFTAGPIDENSGEDQVVYTATATDAGQITWSLENSGDVAAFDIDADSGEVTLTEDPDHETKASYTFTVMARDEQGNTSRQPVTLTITDLDEADPIITSGATAAAINENSGAGQVVYTATADDTGDISGGVTFSLASGGDRSAFTINSDTGAVTLIENPDFEDQSSYTFNVVATDAAGNSDQQTVTLNINDVDDTGPSVTNIALTGATGRQNNTLNAGDTVTVTVTMSESTTVSTAGGTPRVALNVGGSTVFANYLSGSGTSSLAFQYTVQAGDNDGNGISIPSNALAANGGTLRDGAGNPADPGHGAVGNNASFLVDTTAPVITSASTATAINEGNTAGQLVYDANADGPVTWSLTGADAEDFTIDPGDGEVTIDVVADFESQSSYAFTVVATDAAGNTDEQAVTLAINDVDENAPSVTSIALTAATGRQNNTLNAGDTVTVTVTMSESTFVSGGTPRVALAIGSDTAFATLTGGSGTTSLTFQYTVQAGDTDANGISIPANAVDANGSTLQDSAGNPADLDHGSVAGNPSFLVDTTAPVITSGGTATAIDEGSGAGQVVYDAEADGSVTWTLTGDDADEFTIASSGEVTLTEDPDFESQSSYTFTVVATDAAGNADEQAVTLTINDVDESGPIVSNVALTGSSGAQNNTLNAGDTVTVTVTMSENTTVGTAGGTPRVALNVGGSTEFASYMSGSGTTSLTFQYTVQPGDNDANGISIPNNALEANGGTLQDNAGNPADLDHNPVPNNASFLVDTTAPVITSGGTATAIDEGSGAGQLVYDAEADGPVTWSLTGDDAGEFTIDPGDGEVTLNEDPDFESQSSYAFTVVATDAAGNTDEQAVTLGINDVLDGGGGSISSLSFSFDSGAAADTNVVVFDLVQGSSSDHSGRTFQDGVSYDIYIRAASDDAAVRTSGGGAGTWGTWSGAANLGSDDRIVLVGNGSAIEGPGGGTVTQVLGTAAAISWRTAAAASAAGLQGATFARFTATGTDGAQLFDTALPAGFLAGQDGNLGTMYALNMPSGILTSQGLA